jgi:hypothetical protein
MGKITTVTGIDPGPERTAVVQVQKGRMYELCGAAWVENEILSNTKMPVTGTAHGVQIFCEDVQCYGMPVGETVFMTCRWIGRLWERAENYGIPFTRVTEPKVKLHLCGQMRAKDPHVRRATMDRFERTGGGSDPEIGTKSQPGPLYLFKEVSATCKKETGKSAMPHLWSALAVAVYGIETLELESK